MITDFELEQGFLPKYVYVKFKVVIGKVWL